MLNSAPLNSWPLNALAGGAESDPVVIEPPKPPSPPLPPIPTPPGEGVYPGFPVSPPPAGHSFRWSAVVTLGGVDVTELLTGSIRVDREEGAAGIAEFSLFYMPGQSVQSDLAGRTVIIDYITDDGADAAQVRLFTGLVAEPRWDAPSRIMQITATDNLQHKVEAMPIAQIDSLTQGMWSEDVFAPIEGRSRWDYAQERMSTRAASLDKSAEGVLRVTDWRSSVSPHYVFGADTTIYNSISVSLAQLSSVTNRVEIDIAYRYPRLSEARAAFKWAHPAGGFCNWRQMSSELPDKNMIYQATSGAALVPVTANWIDLPPTHPDPCATGQPWINRHEGLLLGASWTGARRWTQTVTENYRFTLAAQTGVVEGKQVISRSGVNITVGSEPFNDWASSLVSIDDNQPKPVIPITLEPGDQSDEARRTAAISCALTAGKIEIIAAHRKTQVGWSVPTSMALGVDLAHTVEIDDQYTHAKGKCVHRIDDLDFGTGSAITTLTIAVMRGGGVNDPLTVPARLGANDPHDGGPEWADVVTLATQLGGRFISPTYNEELNGFSGNYSTVQDFTLETFPRRMAITAPSVDETLIDEKTHKANITYNVGITNDILEL